jgi:hypothetical protein
MARVRTDTKRGPEHVARSLIQEGIWVSVVSAPETAPEADAAERPADDDIASAADDATATDSATGRAQTRGAEQDGRQGLAHW